MGWPKTAAAQRTGGDLGARERGNKSKFGMAPSKEHTMLNVRQVGNVVGERAGELCVVAQHSAPGSAPARVSGEKVAHK